MAWFAADFECSAQHLERGQLPPDALRLRLSLDALQERLIAQKLLPAVCFFLHCYGAVAVLSC